MMNDERTEDRKNFERGGHDFMPEPARSPRETLSSETLKKCPEIPGRSPEDCRPILNFPAAVGQKPSKSVL
jgi:hypothetical protein